MWCPSHWRLGSVIALCMALAIGLCRQRAFGAEAGPGQTRLPVPEAPRQAEAEKLIRNLFRAEYAKRDPPSRQALAARLLQQAKDTTDDPVARFVLLREARDLAVSAGDLQLAFEAIEAMAAVYVADAAEMKLSAAAALLRFDLSPRAGRAVAQLLLKLGNALVADERDDAAVRALGLAEAAARNAADGPLLNAVQTRAAEVRRIQTEYARAKAAADLLARDPDNPDANLTLGRFLCFYRGDWDKGIPLLAKGSDKALKALAETELTTPALAEAQCALGDAWWAQADKQTSSLKAAYQQRGAFWYRRAAPALVGIRKTLAEKRIAEASAAASPAHSVIDLLAMIDLKKDVTAGAWTRRADGLASDASETARIEFPYRPPDEYDFRIEFTRAGNDDTIQILSKDQATFRWLMGGAGGTMCCIGLIDGKQWDNPSTVRLPQPLRQGQRYLSVVEVRNAGVRAYINGRLVAQWKTDYHDLSIPGNRALRTSGVLAIESYFSPTVFHSAEVLEVTGKGQPLR